MDKDGVWGFECLTNDPGVMFHKSAFCFGDRVTVITTDIRHGEGVKTEEKALPFVTTLFQCAFGLGGPDAAKYKSVPPETEPCVIDGKEIKEFPYEIILPSGLAHWLTDNKGDGFHIPAGNPPVSLKRRAQSWTYCYKPNYMKPPAERSSENGWEGNPKNFNPTSGDFALAWFENGTAPEFPDCVYTIMPRATREKMESFAAEMKLETGNLKLDKEGVKLENRNSKLDKEGMKLETGNSIQDNKSINQDKDLSSSQVSRGKGQVSSIKFQASGVPPYIIIQKDAKAHILWDRDSNTTGYVIFDADWSPLKEVISHQPVLTSTEQSRSSKSNGSSVVSDKKSAVIGRDAKSSKITDNCSLITDNFLLKVNRPCYVMIRNGQEGIRLSVASTDIKAWGWATRPVLEGEIVLSVAGDWKIKAVKADSQLDCKTAFADGATQIRIPYKDFTPIHLDLAPAKP